MKGHVMDTEEQVWILRQNADNTLLETKKPITANGVSPKYANSVRKDLFAKQDEIETLEEIYFEDQQFDREKTFCTKCRICSSVLAIVVLISVLFIVCVCTLDIALPIRCQLTDTLDIQTQECGTTHVLKSLSVAKDVSSIDKNLTDRHLNEHFVNISCAKNNTDANCKKASQALIEERETKWIILSEHTWEMAWEMLHDTEDWKLQQGKDKDTGMVSSKTYAQIGLMFKLEAYIDLSPEQMYDLLVTKGEQMPQWNPLMQIFKVYPLQTTDAIDATYMATNAAAGGIISPRETVALRNCKTREGNKLCSGTSINHPDIPPNPNFVRSDSKGDAMAFCAVPNEPNQTYYVWIMNPNIGGWVPDWMVQKVVPKTMLELLAAIENKAWKSPL